MNFNNELQIPNDLSLFNLAWKLFNFGTSLT